MVQFYTYLCFGKDGKIREVLKHECFQTLKKIHATWKEVNPTLKSRYLGLTSQKHPNNRGSQT